MTERADGGQAAKGERSAEGEIRIEAPVERVWRALTEARELERWFPLDAKVEPGPEGRIWMSWGRELGGWSAVQVWDPPRHLRVAWVMGDGPAQVTDYRLEGTGGTTHLRVVTSGFPDGAEWDDMVEGTRLGWRFELRQLKHYLERHEGEDRRAAYLRRRIALPRDEAWARLTGEDGIVDDVAGDVFDRTAGWQLAATGVEPGDGILRVTIDPSHDEPDARDVSVFIADWGATGGGLDDAVQRWGRRLDRLFPEGRPMDQVTG